MGALIQLNQRRQTRGKLDDTVADTRTCASCSAEFLPRGPFGEQCPRCLFELGVKSGSAPAGAEVIPWEPRRLDLRPGQTVSHYRLVEKIGEGGMGVVWKAEDTVLGRPIAIKFLSGDAAVDETRRALFLEEAKSAALVADARIVHVHELGHEDNLDFIVMEYVEGKPLNKILDGSPLQPHKVAELGYQIAQALSKAHRRGLLHRDLKPANVLVNSDGDVKVVDFGLATLFDRSDTGRDSQLTKSIVADEPVDDRKLVGTLAYMSPEQARMEKLDTRSDVFSLGTVLYEMTTGKLPFVGATNKDVLRAVERARPTPVHELLATAPMELGRIIQKCLAPRRGNRYQSMEDLAVDLKRLGRELDIGSSPSYKDLAGELDVPRRRRWGRVVSVGLVSIAAALGAWRWFGPAASLDSRTVMIVPLEVRGSSAGGDYAGQAFAEGVAMHLARAGELTVLPLADGGLDGRALLERARRSGAGRVLTGALMHHGDGVQARLSLLDASRGTLLWGTESTDPDGDLPGMTSSLAKEVVEQLGTTLPRMYDYPTNLTGGPEMALSPLLGQTIGALRRGAGRSTALEPSRRLVEAFPDELDAHMIRAFALYSSTQSVEAIRAEVESTLAAMERIDPANPYSTFYRAQLHRLDWRNQEAIELFTEILERDDLTPAFRGYALRMRGLALKDVGAVVASLADMEESKRLDPTRAWTYQYLAQPLIRAGRPDEAVAAARHAIALAPDSTAALMNLRRVLGSLGRFEEAVDPTQRACEISVDRKLSACALYAVSLYRAGHAEKARAAAKEVLAMGAEEDPAAAYNLARYHALRGDSGQALRFLRRASDLGYDSEGDSPNEDPDFASLRGHPEFTEILGDFSRDRIAEARRAVELEPDSFKAWHDLGDAVGWGLGSWSEAVDLYEKSCALTTTQDPCAHYAYALYQVDRREEALKAARLASEREDEDWSTYHLACFYALAGDRDAAIDHLRRSLALGYWDGMILADPDLDALRGDPEFEALLATRTGRK